MTTRYHNWLAWLLVLVPVVASLVYVGRYGVNCGWEDQFDNMVTVFEKWYSHTLHLSDFWSTGKEHRHFFPWITMFLLGLASRWNNLAELYFNQCLLAAMLVLMILAMRLANPAKPYVWLSIPLAALLFSPRQCQNMLTGYQIVFVLTAAMALATFFSIGLLMDHRRWKLKIAAALISATVACYSSGQGMLVWPVGLVQLVAMRLTRSHKITLVSIWTVAWIVEWIVYSWGLERTAVWKFSWEYFSAIAGGALYPLLLEAETVGTGLVLLTLIGLGMALVDWRKGRHAFWLALILFGLLTEVQTTLGRSVLGASQALSSRYATFSLFVVIGLYGLFVSLRHDKFAQAPAALWGVLAGVATVGLVISQFKGNEVGKEWRQERDYHRFVFLTADTQPDEALPTAPWENGSTVRKQIAFLKDHGLNVFASTANEHEHWKSEYEPLPLLAAPARLNIGKVRIDDKTGLISIDGYALDAQTDEPVGGVFLEIDGKFYPTYYGWSRDDVVQSLAAPKARDCGFRREFSLTQLGPGEHMFRTWVLAADGRAYYQPPAMLAIVGPEGSHRNQDSKKP